MQIAIRNDQDIIGVTISQIEHKIKMLADDTTLILANINSLIKLISILNNFTNLSGLKLNMQKTEVIPLGALRKKQLSLPSFLQDIK